jgi:hypothetical protein
MNLKRSMGSFPLCVLCCCGLLGAAQVRLPAGTPIQVKLKADLRSDRVSPGDRVDFEVAHPLVVQGVVVIPQGAVAWGAVQSVKKEKEIKFDVEGVRLPNLQEIRLRSIRDKPKNPGKDQIKVVMDMGGYVGALRGAEFTAYVDEDVEIDAAPAQETAPAPAVSTPPVAAPQPEAQSAMPASAAGVTPTGQAVAAPPQPTAAAAGTASTSERVTVECFSIPMGADILIDGDYYGNTPSILKLTATSHKLEMQLPGYKTYSEDLNLAPGAGVRTIRATLEASE